jgi:hypothetical protein
MLSDSVNRKLIRKLKKQEFNKNPSFKYLLISITVEHIVII